MKQKNKFTSLDARWFWLFYFQDYDAFHDANESGNLFNFLKIEVSVNSVYN